MGATLLYSSVSVDGYATGPGGDLTRLHRWLFDFALNREIPFSDEHTERFRDAGAVVFGRRTWDSGQEPWGDEEVFSAPVFVVTHEERAPIARNGTVFSFVSGEATDVLDAARAAAGDGDVVIMGSPDVAGQFLRAGLVDALLLHVVPVLLGGGTRLFGADPDGPTELRLVSVRPGPEVTAVRYEVDRVT